MRTLEETRGRSLRRHGEGLTAEYTWGWRHTLGRRETPKGLWPMEDSCQGRDSPEGPKSAADPFWSSNSKKSRVKTSKNCGRGTDRNDYTYRHYNNHTQSCHSCPNPNLEEHSLGKVGTCISVLFKCWTFLRKGKLGHQWSYITFMKKGQICFTEDVLTLLNSCSKEELLKNISCIYLLSVSLPVLLGYVCAIRSRNSYPGGITSLP